jgi:hypothetical protein
MAKPPSKGYNGNPNLPLPEEEISLTESELKEYIKCQSDPNHFIETYVKIVNVDKGIIPFKMYGFQKDIVQTLEDNRFVICKLARQTGKSTVVVQGYFLWFVLFHIDVSVCLLANKEATAIQLLDRLKESFQLLPRFLKQGVVKWDAKLIKFGNGARMRAEATSASAVRGDSFNIVFLDEFAFVPDNIAEDFIKSVFPTISSGQTTKLFIVSTPQGYNLFYKIWNDAENNRNKFVHIGYTWSDVPGRDKLDKDGQNEWEKEMRANMGDAAFEQEHNCSFMGSANTLIPPWRLQTMHYENPEKEFFDGRLKIYKMPIKATDETSPHIYLITVDVGQGQGLDSSVANVFDISQSPFEQVAIWRDNKTSAQLFAPHVYDLGRLYNNAFILHEINGEGFIVADTLHQELEYENVMTIIADPKKGQRLSGGFHPKCRLGLKVTEATKKIACAGLKSLMEKDKLKVVDYTTYRELTTYVMKKSTKNSAKGNTYEAEVGNNDDCVATLILVGWLTQQTGFENYVGLSMRQLMMSDHKPATLEAPPLGFLGDRAQTSVIGRTSQGIEIVEDNDFWKDDDTRWLN